MGNYNPPYEITDKIVMLVASDCGEIRKDYGIL